VHRSVQAPATLHAQLHDGTLTDVEVRRLPLVEA